MSSKTKAPASFEELANQVFEKSKQLSMSIKEQCKLVQEYLKARIDGSDGSDAEYNSEPDSDSESESESESDSDFEEDSLTDSDERTEESSDESESEPSEVEERTKPSDTHKSATAGPWEKQISKDEPEQSRLVAFVAPLKSSAPPQPAPRIQRRLTMAGGLIAPHSRSSVPVPSKSGKVK
ncbi:bifunctional lysine-specific demethylase and histidyl-hydroxylase NO66 [Drosophila mauritiana]|uniref:Bifunctional lysine-specific demethylase and histidyl-hydroxylase NO66 n=1 Tax=Drosophila mauritiana TaxID=7226 RepID=A0A6P8JKI8_DROMA|nr:bifunctional lysine-specific demethylase and histidyl-hydroxylase NO66 [Drosophila mauritiana]